MEELVERNDVDVSKLFNWGRVFEVVDPVSGEVVSTVYMKLLGDADVNKARVYAIRKSSELRRKLRDLDSDERIAYVRDISELTEEDIENFILIFSTREIANNARKTVKVKTPKPPKSDASLEQMEKYQKEIDAYPSKYSEAVADSINKELNKIRKELSKNSIEENYKQYVKLLIDELCEREAFVAFRDMQTYLGCFKSDDYKERFFSSFEEFDNLEPNIKNSFKDAYETIDVNLSDLKKLRRATR